MALGVEAAFVTDAEAAAVPGLAVGAHFGGKHSANPVLEII
jgi:hypothetical protein